MHINSLDSTFWRYSQKLSKVLNDSVERSVANTFKAHHITRIRVNKTKLSQQA